jgi:hypothetical protein
VCVASSFSLPVASNPAFSCAKSLTLQGTPSVGSEPRPGQVWSAFGRHIGLLQFILTFCCFSNVAFVFAIFFGAFVGVEEHVSASNSKQV